MRGERGTACDDGRWRSGRWGPTRVQAPTCGAVRPGQSAPGAPARGAQTAVARSPERISTRCAAYPVGAARPVRSSTNPNLETTIKNRKERNLLAPRRARALGYGEDEADDSAKTEGRRYGRSRGPRPDQRACTRGARAVRA